MSGLRTAALGAACSLLVACSTKPAGDGSASSAIDTGSVSAGASAASIDSVSHAPAAATAPPTDTARPAATPATTAGTGAATTSAAPAAGTGSAGKTTVPAATRPSAPTPTTPARGAKVAPTASPSVAKPAAATAAPTTAAASGTTPSATPTAAPAAATASAAQGGTVKVNKFMSYDAAAKTVTLEIIAAYNSVQGGFNFNGGSNGSHTITVPAGWQVTMHVKNVDAIPHSAIVITDQRPLPNAPDAPAIPRAYTSHVNDGLQPQTGADDLSFRASKPGKYLIYCGVPGHGPSGMFIGFVVSESATVPSYQM